MKVKKVLLIVMIFIIAGASTGSVSKDKPILLYNVEIIPDNYTPHLDKGGSLQLNLTVIGYNVTGGTSISFDYQMFAYSKEGVLIENPPDINLSFDPHLIVFPKNVNSTDTPYKLYSRLIITSSPTSQDAYYYVNIEVKENVKVYSPQFHLTVGKGGYVIPGPGTPIDMHPAPDAVNVPLNTSISVYFGRAGKSTGTLDIKPEVEIGNVTTDRDGLGARFTFYPAKPLRSNTTYTVTVTVGSNSASWQFTTANESISAETAKTPKAVPGFGIAITVMAIFLGIGGRVFGKR